MPNFSNAPDKMNRMMEHVYSFCRMSGGSKQKCSMEAIGEAKKYFTKKGGKWIEKKTQEKKK